MYLKVKNLLEQRQAELVALIPIIADHYNTLLTFTEEIAIANGKANADIRGYTETKQDYLEDMAKAALRISRGASAYFKAEGDPGKQEEIYFTKSELFYAPRDTDAYTRCMQVYDLANPIKANLAPYGIQPADVDEVNTKAALYLGVIQEPASKRGEKVSYGKMVDDLYLETDDFLKETLDPTMGTLEDLEPQLYYEYLEARKIDDNPTGSSGIIIDTSETLAGGSNEVIATLETYNPAYIIEIFYEEGTDPLTVGLNSENVAEPAGDPITLNTGSMQDVLENLGVENGRYIVAVNEGSGSIDFRVIVREGE